MGTMWSAAVGFYSGHMLIGDATSDPDGVLGWATIVISVISGLGSGALGALIAAKIHRGIAQAERRDKAQQALWSYHRVLRDWASEAEANAIHESRFTTTNEVQLNAARAVAYPFRSYLAKDKQALLTRNSLPDWHQEMGSMGVAIEFDQWAQDLETELERVFGQDER